MRSHSFFSAAASPPHGRRTSPPVVLGGLVCLWIGIGASAGCESESKPAESSSAVSHSGGPSSGWARSSRSAADASDRGATSADRGASADGGRRQATRDAGLSGDAGDAAAPASEPNAATKKAAEPSLRAAADDAQRLIGAAVSAAHLDESRYAQTAQTEFDLLTPEDALKWDATEPTEGMFRFDAGDALVAFARQHGMRVKGHTLVWHSQLPGWMSGLRNENAVRTAMLNHITQVVTHYKGKLMAWDVVNEAVADDGKSLRDSVFAKYLGSDCLSTDSTAHCYLDEAFKAARAADPDVALYYNDYGAEGNSAKADYVYMMVRAMLARGVPIDGVGLQLHTGAPDKDPSRSELRANMARLAALNLDLVISELDIEMCERDDPEAQRTRYHDLVAVCVAEPGCKAVTVWGVTDKYSVRNGQTCAAPKPLLFDDDYTKKPAYAGVFDAFLGR